MRDKVLNFAIKIIRDKYNYNNTRIAELKYGLHCMYTLITKFIVISAIALILGILKSYLIFIFFYNCLRMQGVGFHANTNLQCWILSIITFISFPLLSLAIEVNIIIQLIISLLFSLILIRYAPADTEKRPIINSNIRKRKKIMMFFICLVYIITMMFSTSQFLNNILMFALICEALFINPFIYKLFNQKYNNYKYYIIKESGKEVLN